MIQTLNPHHEQIVTMGMSCVGKTTFANLLRSEGYHYHSFDSQYTYLLTALPEVSRKGNWKQIVDKCCESPWILDNWTTEDYLGRNLYQWKPNACIYLLYDSHKGILDRYRIKVEGPDAYYMMYEKMYKIIEFEKYQSVRFFHSSGGDYRETSIEDFRNFVESQGGKDETKSFDSSTWSWK